jgi:hypothetical protein
MTRDVTASYRLVPAGWLVCNVVSGRHHPYCLFIDKCDKVDSTLSLGLEMGQAKPALGRAGPGYWAGWVMKNVEP